MGRQCIENAFPVDQLERVDDTRGSIGEQGEATNGVRAVARESAGDGVVCGPRVAGGDPVAGGCVGKRVLFEGRPVLSLVILGSADGAAIVGDAEQDLRHQGGQAGVGEHGYRIASVGNESAVGKDQVLQLQQLQLDRSTVSANGENRDA